MTLHPLATPPPSRPPARPVSRHLALVPHDDQPPLPLTLPGSPADAACVSPLVTRAARTLALVVVEALAGRRPVAQVRAVADARVARSIAELARARWARGMSLRSIRVQQPSPGAVEVAFHVGDAVRSRAGALRLEQRPEGWRCVVLDVGAG